MIRLPVALLCLALVSCSTPIERAQKIIAPITKKAEKAAGNEVKKKTKLTEQKGAIEAQKSSIDRLSGSADAAMEIAERLDRERPNGDTARLKLEIRTITAEKDKVVLQNKVLAETNDALFKLTDEQQLTISQLQTEAAKAVPKIAGEIEKEKWWAKFWKVYAIIATGVAALAVGLIALRTWLKTTFPVVFFWL